MRITERAKFIRWTTEVERALGLEFRHEHTFFWIENLRRLAHEADAAHDNGGGRMIPAESRHLQRVRNATAGFLGKILQIGMDIVVRDQHRVVRHEKRFNRRFQSHPLFR